MSNDMSECVPPRRATDSPIGIYPPTLPAKALVAFLVRRYCCGRLVMTTEDHADAAQMATVDRIDEYGNIVYESVGEMGS